MLAYVRATTQRGHPGCDAANRFPTRAFGNDGGGVVGPAAVGAHGVSRLPRFARKDRRRQGRWCARFHGPRFASPWNDRRGCRDFGCWVDGVIICLGCARIYTDEGSLRLFWGRRHRIIGCGGIWSGLSALGFFWILFPRALPWAGMDRAVDAWVILGFGVACAGLGCFWVGMGFSAPGFRAHYLSIVYFYNRNPINNLQSRPYCFLYPIDASCRACQ